MPNYTPNFALSKPLVDDPADEGVWGGLLNANFDALDTLVQQALLRRVPLWQWTRDEAEGDWESYTATVSQNGDNLRFTNTQASNSDAALFLTVPVGKTVVIRANTSGNSGVPAPTMHFGDSVEGWGGIGFDFDVNRDHAITIQDSLLVIYMNTNADTVDAWVDFSEFFVSVIESGSRITVAELAPSSPQAGDIWLDTSGTSTVIPNLLPAEYINWTDHNWNHVDTGGISYEEGVTDESGGSNATRVTFIGADNNHIWLEAPDAPDLELGSSYTIRAWVRSDNYTGDFELGYYDGSTGDGDADYAFTGDGTWQEIVHTFTVSVDATDPRIRLIGWGNGADGLTLDIGRVRVELNT